MSLPEESPSPSNKRRDIITRFKEEYATALAEAEISEAMTASEGWLRLYAGHVRLDRERRRDFSLELKNIADQLEQVALSEDGIKQLADVKKQIVEHGEQCDAFDRHTVLPVRLPVENCEKIIEQAKHAADRDESAAPLVNIGICELMKEAISAVRRAKWDNDSGQVVIV